MASTDPSPVTRWRKSRQRQGLVRVEVQVRKTDAARVRDVATALAERERERERETRAILREGIAKPRGGGLKALVAPPPLDGIDRDRPCGFDRDVFL